jgi:hypothetical protein
MGHILIQFVKKIDRRYQPGGRAAGPRSGGGFYRLYGPGSGAAGKGGEQSFSRLQRRGGPVQTAKFQGPVPETGPGNPEGGGQGQGARTEVNNGVAIVQGKGQGRQKAAKTVEVPGEKITEIGGEVFGLAQIRNLSAAPPGGEEQGKFRHIPGQGRKKSFWNGKKLLNKSGKAVKNPAAFRGKGRKKIHRT